MTPEPITAAATVAASAIGRKERTPGLIKRMLGPAADEIGIELAELIKERHTNVQAVIDAADRKLGDHIETPGAIPLRVAAKILGEGSYCSDRVMGEYLGGVLASSRTPDGRDDRGSKWVNLITSLSAYEIRLHYILYASARALYLERDTTNNWGNVNGYDYTILTTVLTWEEVVLAMDFSESEDPLKVFPEAMFALGAEELVTRWEIRPSILYEERNYASESSSLFSFAPTPRGIQLFMWAQGHGDSWSNFADKEVSIPDIEVPIPVGCTPADVTRIPESSPSPAES